MQFKCTYSGHAWRDEKKGQSYFSVRPVYPYPDELQLNKYQTVNIHGVIQDIPKMTPLTVICDDSPKKNSYGTFYTLASYKFSSDPQTIKKFLLDSSFSGIGSVTAEKLSKTIPDLFAFAEKENAVEICQKIGINETDAEQFVGRIREMIEIRQIMEVLSKYGADYEAVLKYYDYKKKNGFKLNIEKRPYSLMYAGIPFVTCEHVAAKNNHPQYADDRLIALARAAYEIGTSCGDTKISYARFAKGCNYLEECAASKYRTSPTLITSVFSKCGLKLKYEDGLYVYDCNIYKTEQDVARHIYRLYAGNKTLSITDEIISNIEKKYNIEYSEEQREAFSLLKKSGLKVLTGGPGTGKTTVVNGLIDAYRTLAPEKIVTLCAPTGCAAKRLSEATGEHAQTIHKLLDIKPFGDTYIQTKNENNQLNTDLLIIDEASMVGTELFFMLIKAIKNNATVILVGDEDQLPPVDKGNTLHDILNSDFIEKCRLKTVHRQKDDSVIIENSIRIREGNESLLEKDKEFTIIRCNSEEEIKEKVLLLYEYNESDPYSTKIYSPTKKISCACSTKQINTELHTRNADAAERKSYTFGHFKQLSKGDPIIFTQNNYKLGVYNGDVGIVTAVIEESSKVKVEIRTQDGEDIELSGADIANIELAYAITVHKSQGGECDTAIIVLPQNPTNMLQRSLVYVAVTRAKKKVIIITEGDALEQAIQNGKKQKRFTGLELRIKEFFHKSGKTSSEKQKN